jgi:subfamily B ATP-binding cassette protein MsbA
MTTTTTTTSTGRGEARPPSHRQVGRRLLAYLRRHAGKLALGLFCGLLAGLVPAGLGTLIQLFTEKALQKDLTLLAYVCAGVVALYAALWGFSFGQSVLLAEVAQRVGMRMRGDVYAHLHSLSLSYFHKRRTGALMATLTSDVPKLQNAAMMVKDVVATPVQVVVYLAALFFTSWRLTLMALLVVPLMALAIQVLTRRIRGISQQAQQKMADVTAVMEESLSGARVVKAFTAERREIERFDRENREAMAVSMQGVRRGARLRPTIDLIGALGIALTLWFGGREVALDRLEFGAWSSFSSWCRSWPIPSARWAA